MATELATTTYLLAEPFDLAVKSLRKVLADANIELAGEMDMSSRIRERLLMRTAPCRVFFVAAKPAACAGLDADPRAAALTPLHIVLSGHGLQTEIHMLRALPAEDGPLDRPTMEFFRHLQVTIAQAVERIAMRSTLVA